MGQIHEVLPKVAAEVGAIGKEHKNTQQNYSFRSVEDALSATGPIFARHGITVSVNVVEHKVDVSERSTSKGSQAVYHATLRMGVSFWAADGSSVENIMAGEGLDYAGDKATNKAMSAAFKYGIFFGLCIPVDERAIEDSDRPARNGKHDNGKPGDEIDAVTKALAAIKNAPTEKDLARYGMEIDRRKDAGGYTPEQVKQLEGAIEERTRRIRGGAAAAGAR